jgi:hypothetical protein
MRPGDPQRETSLQAFKEMLESGKINMWEHRVLQVLVDPCPHPESIDGEWTKREVAKQIPSEIDNLQTVNPRFKPLWRKGLIVECVDRPDHYTGKECITYKLAPPGTKPPPWQPGDRPFLPEIQRMRDKAMALRCSPDMSKAAAIEHHLIEATLRWVLGEVEKLPREGLYE